MLRLMLCHVNTGAAAQLTSDCESAAKVIFSALPYGMSSPSGSACRSALSVYGDGVRLAINKPFIQGRLVLLIQCLLK